MGPADELIFVEGHSSGGTWEEIQRVAAAFPDRPIRVFNSEAREKAPYNSVSLKPVATCWMILDADLSVAPESLCVWGRGNVAEHPCGVG